MAQKKISFRIDAWGNRVPLLAQLSGAPVKDYHFNTGNFMKADRISKVFIGLDLFGLIPVGAYVFFAHPEWLFTTLGERLWIAGVLWGVISFVLMCINCNAKYKQNSRGCTR